MAGVNKVILVGNLGKDPEIRTLDNGRSVASFSLATTESYKDKNGQKVDNTEWHNIVMWSPLAEIAQKYLKKGNQVYLEGKLTTRSWDDKEGNKRYTTEVVVRDMTLLGSPSGAGGRNEADPGPAATSSQMSAPQGGSADADDLPF
jgi:single-strand DNA-binding protein